MDIYSENIFQECPKSSDRYPTANVIKCGGLHVGIDRCHNAKGHLHTGVLFSHQYYLFRIQFHPFRLTCFYTSSFMCDFLGRRFRKFIAHNSEIEFNVRAIWQSCARFSRLWISKFVDGFHFFEVQYEDKYELIYARHSDFNKSKGFWTPTCLIRQKYW